MQVWPILCAVAETHRVEPMIVGVFCGETKPQTTISFLRPLVDELIYLINCGLTINGHRLNIRINHFICDSPARSLLKGSD